MKKLALTLLLAASAISNALAASPYFHVQVTGHGSPMVLIPGLSCSGEVWDSTVVRYSKDHECHVLTLAGFAGVPAVEGQFVDAEVQAISAYLAEQHLEKPVIVGHSLGGFLALKLAAAHPQAVGKLVIVDALPFFADMRQPGCTAEQARATAEQMANYMNASDDATHEKSIKSGAFTRMLVDKDNDHERIVAWGLSSSRKTSTQAMVEMYGSDLRPTLGSIKAPILVLGAAKALAASVPLPAIEKAYAAQYTNAPLARVAVTATANHFIMFDDPAWLFSQIDTFLNNSQIPAN